MVSKVLPATWKWKDTIPEVNEVNTSFGLKEVSLSNLNKIRRRSFEEYNAKRPGDNFVRCSSYDKYHSLWKLHQPGTQVALFVATKLQTHLNKAWAHREPHIEEWILNSQTIVYWKTLVAVQDLEVVLQWTRQCSLRHVVCTMQRFASHPYRRCRNLQFLQHLYLLS